MAPTPSPGQYALEWNEEDKRKHEEGDIQMLTQIGKQIFLDDSRPVLVFDGVCNLCNAFVNRILDQDKEGIFRFAQL